AGLAQDPGVEVDLAHVVEDAGESETLQILAFEAESRPQVDREVGHAVHVPMEVLNDVLHDLDQDFGGKVSHLPPVYWMCRVSAGPSRPCMGQSSQLSGRPNRPVLKPIGAVRPGPRP